MDQASDQFDLALFSDAGVGRDLTQDVERKSDEHQIQEYQHQRQRRLLQRRKGTGCDLACFLCDAHTISYGFLPNSLVMISTT